MRCRSARARDLSREDGASAGSSRNNVGIRPPAMDGRASLVHRSAAPRPPPRSPLRPAPPPPPPSAVGRVGPPREGEGKRQPAIWDLFRRALDLGVPFREQAAALFGGAVFGEIEVVELDLAELRRVG